MDINERIKLIRDENNLSTRAFAERLGMTAGAISMIETGKRNATSQVIVSICREFGINKEWLENGTGEKKSPICNNSELAEISANLFKRDDLEEKEKNNLLKIINVASEMTPEQINMMIELAHKLSDMVKENELPE